MDCDNDHTEVPSDWWTPERIAERFPGVPFYVHYSRNHMKPKTKERTNPETGERETIVLSARPKFHVLFLINEFTDAGKYRDLKLKVWKHCQIFDGNALDAGRQFFGTPDAQVAFFPGDTMLDDFIKTISD